MMDPCQGRCRAGLLEVLNDCQSCAFVRMIRGPGYDCAWWFEGVGQLIAVRKVAHASLTA
jgi:hypothetical protein